MNRRRRRRRSSRRRHRTGSCGHSDQDGGIKKARAGCFPRAEPTSFDDAIMPVFCPTGQATFWLNRKRLRCRTGAWCAGAAIPAGQSAVCRQDIKSGLELKVPKPPLRVQTCARRVASCRTSRRPRAGRISRRQARSDRAATNRHHALFSAAIDHGRFALGGALVGVAILVRVAEGDGLVDVAEHGDVSVCQHALLRTIQMPPPQSVPPERAGGHRLTINDPRRIAPRGLSRTPSMMPWCQCFARRVKRTIR